MHVARRLAALGMALAALLLPAGAAGSEVDAAQALSRLGLFQGTLEGRSDVESLALERPATRIEALVMFLRLLGRDQEARSSADRHPFTDVPDWAQGYAGYAYQLGLTTGVGGGAFGTDRPISLNESVSFLLRALGYSDAEGDFSWDTAAQTGASVGLYDPAWMASRPANLTRGDLAQLSFAALSLPLRAGGQTLAGTLAETGAVEGAQLEALGLPLTAEPSVPRPNQVDPLDFTLIDQYGKEHTLSDYRGRTVFLTFWASWCPPCREELPDIEALYHDWNQNQGELVVLGVVNPNDVSGKREDGAPETIQDFLTAGGYTFPVLMDANSEVLAAYETAYGTAAFPTTFMISPDGKVFSCLVGSMTRGVMDDLITQTMAGSPAE